MRSTSASRGTALVAGLVALLVGCVGTPGGQSVKPAPVPSTPSTESTEAVTIADGRQIDLACRGQGEPTVVFISGTGGAADEWMVAADPSDANGVPERSERSVFETVSRTSRVCAYDRPGTTLASGQPTLTTAVVQPTSAQDGVDDLELLLASSGENPASLVLVGASWGGLIAQLYARSHPAQVRGLILVDSASAHLPTVLSPEQWDAWIEAISTQSTGVSEEPEYVASMQQLATAVAIPDIPVTVLSSDVPWDLGVTPGLSTWPAWLAAQELLAQEWNATHVRETDSGHGIHVEQPEVVAQAVKAIVDQVRTDKKLG